MKAKPAILTAAALLAAGCLCHAEEARPSAPPAGAPPGVRRAGGEHEREGASRLSPLLTALDTNGDGALDEQEIANAAAALKKLDKNGDGKITTDELRPAPRTAPGQAAANTEAMVTRLMQLDKNSDGKLSKDELPERMQAMLEKGDLDKDGVLSKEELIKLVAAQTPAAGPARGEGRRERDDDDDDDD